jgi:O-antigen/teichoic acid export membrane protein
MFISERVTLKVSQLVSPRSWRLGGELFWVGLGQAIAALGAVVGVRLLTGVLPPHVYGELALGMTIATLVQQTILSPLSGASLRFFAPAREANQLRYYFHGVSKLLSQGTVLLVTVAGALSMGLWISGHGKWLGLTISAFLFALLSGYSSVLDGMQNAARQRVVVAWHGGLASWLRFLTAVALIGVLGAFSQVAMFGYALASVVVLGSQFWFFRRQIYSLTTVQPTIVSSDYESWTKQMRNYAWPFATWGLFTWAQMASDRWALQMFTTTSDVGMYAVLYQLGYYPITLLSVLVMQLITPVLFSQGGDGSDSARMQSVRRLNNLLILGTLFLTVLGTLSVFLFHQLIFLLLVAPEYHGISFLLPWMVLSGGIFASGQVASLLLMTNVNTQHLIAPKIVTALLGVVLNFVGAYALGLQGVVFVNLLFSVVYCMWILHLTQKVREKRNSVVGGGCAPPI